MAFFDPGLGWAYNNITRSIPILKQGTLLGFFFVNEIVTPVHVFTTTLAFHCGCDVMEIFQSVPTELAITVRVVLRIKFILNKVTFYQNRFYCKYLKYNNNNKNLNLDTNK